MNGLLLKKIFETQPYSLTFSGNIIAAIKRKYPNIFDTYPVIGLVGDPGTGKTVIAKTCIANPVKMISFLEPAKEVVAFAKENKNEYVLLDDFADIKSEGSWNREVTVFERVVRSSHEGNSAVICMTIESDAKSRIRSQSCMERMLFVSTDDVEKNKFSEVFEDMLAGKADLKEFLGEFDTWFMNLDINIYRDYLQFKEEHKAMGKPRDADLIFFYAEALKLVDIFLKEQNMPALNSLLIKENVSRMWRQRRHVTNRKELTKVLLENMIKSGRFNAYIPKEDNTCFRFQDGTCTRGDFDCRYGNPICMEKTISENTVSYWLTDLILPIERHNSMLIMRPDCMPAICSSIINTPLLVVDVNTLTNLFNLELARYTDDTGLRAKMFVSKELHRLLGKLNRCLITSTGEKSVRYTVPIYVDFNENIIEAPAVVIRLLPDEANSLILSSKEHELVNEFALPGLKYADQVQKIYRLFHRRWTGLACNSGKIES